MKRGSDPAKLQMWHSLFEEFNNSGQSVAQFCRDRDISEASYYQWKKKVAGSTVDKSTNPRRKQLAAKRKVAGFQPVQLRAGLGVANGESGVTVRMPDGIEIALGNDLAVIQQVVGQLLEAGLGDESC